MKHTLRQTIVLAAICGGAVAACAATQDPKLVGTTNTPVVNSITANSNVFQLVGLPSLGNAWNAFASGFVDAEPYVSNGVYTLDSGVLWNSSLQKGKMGAYVGASIPMTQQSAFGLLGSYEGGHWIGGTANIQVGTTVEHVPLIGSVYSFAAAGPDWDFTRDPNTGKQQGIGSYTAAGFQKNWDVASAPSGASPKWYQNINIGVKLGVDNISTISGVGKFAGLSVTKKFK